MAERLSFAQIVSGNEEIDPAILIKETVNIKAGKLNNIDQPKNSSNQSNNRKNMSVQNHGKKKSDRSKDRKSKGNTKREEKSVNNPEQESKQHSENVSSKTNTSSISTGSTVNPWFQKSIGIS